MSATEILLLCWVTELPFLCPRGLSFFASGLVSSQCSPTVHCLSIRNKWNLLLPSTVLWQWDYFKTLPRQHHFSSVIGLVPSATRDWICKWTMPRPYIKIQLWPTTCSNLPGKPTPSSIINSPGSQPAVSQTHSKPDCYLWWQSRKLYNNFSHNQPQMARTWIITSSLPNLCCCFQLKTNQKRIKYVPSPSHRMLASS